MQPYFEINLGFKSDVGRIRKNNEDYIKYFIPTDEKELKQNGCLFIVADGVGGAAKGEVASHFAGDTVIFEYYSSAELPPAERLAKAMQNASREIYDHSQKNGNFTRMATTMVAALILQNNLIVAHVGDSRLYLIREGKIKQLTRDHSVVAEMVRNGAMTEEEARTSKAKNRLSRSIGGEAEVHVDVSTPIPLNLGDRILLCSDGLTRYLDGEDLMAAAQKGDVETVTKDLVKFANEHGGVDNISVILLEIVEKAKIRIKKPLISKAPPEKLGWDEAETEYPEPPSRQKKKIPVWVMIGGAVIGVGILVTGILSSSQSGKEVNGIISTETETPILSAIETSQPTKTEKELNELRKNYSATLQYLDTIKTTETPTSSEDGSNPNSHTDFECIYRINSGDYPEKILTNFGETYSEQTTYSAYETCKILDVNTYTNCDSKFPISDPVGSLPVDKYLIVFTASDIKDENSYNQKINLCINNNGKIYDLK